MRRFLANAVITAGLLVPLSLYGQFRGGSRPAFSGFRGPIRGYASAPRTRPVYNRTWSGIGNLPLHQPPVRPSSLINSGQASCVLNPSYANSPYCRQFYPYGAAYGIEPVYPYWMPSGGYVPDEGPASAPEPPPPDSQLAEQVGNLAAQVEMLREDEAQRNYRSSAGAAATQPMPPATVLVYRDGHEVEVQNYAIVGQTLWVVSDQVTRRVPLADLDLTSTQRANAERGIDFVMPDPQ